MSTRISASLLAIAGVLGAMLTPSGALAQTPKAGCTTENPVKAGGASVVTAATENIQHKNWQPEGGEVQFTITSAVPIASDAVVHVCYRWRTREDVGNAQRFVEAERPSQVELLDSGKRLKVTTTVPKLGQSPEGNRVVYTSNLVPLVDVRIMAINKDETIGADAWTSIGITYVWWAVLVVLFALAIGYLILCFCCARRLGWSAWRPDRIFLCTITAPNGAASLSQFQIVLWTFLVAAAAVYVMALSGELIVITTGTLVLLGISGAATLASKAHSESQVTAANTAAKTAAEEHAEASKVTIQKRAEVNALADLAGAAQNTPNAAATQAELTKKQGELQAAQQTQTEKLAAQQAVAAKVAPRTATPRWSDLIVSDSGAAGPNAAREIDVTRLQMLYFTLIAATFVVIRVIGTYVIPEIPQGFLILMGISNGLYVGSKLTQRS
jgi:hypothetical protein